MIKNLSQVMTPDQRASQELDRKIRATKSLWSESVTTSGTAPNPSNSSDELVKRDWILKKSLTDEDLILHTMKELSGLNIPAEDPLNFNNLIVQALGENTMAAAESLEFTPKGCRTNSNKTDWKQILDILKKNYEQEAEKEKQRDLEEATL